MPLRRKSNGLLRTDGAIWKHCQYKDQERKFCRFVRSSNAALSEGIRVGRRILRVEEIGKRLDDWVITLGSAIDWVWFALGGRFGLGPGGLGSWLFLGCEERGKEGRRERR
jgi:hypothetical protein